jgi:hypothetical protein
MTPKNNGNFRVFSTLLQRRHEVPTVTDTTASPDARGADPPRNHKLAACLHEKFAPTALASPFSLTQNQPPKTGKVAA